MIELKLDQLSGTNRPHQRGVLYIAFNEAFVKEMLNSARSVKEHNPDLSVAAMTSFPIESEYVDYLIRIEPRHIRSKVDFIDRTPFNETLYLDSDTIINGKIDDMFDLLARTDVAAVHDFARKRKKYADAVPEYDRIPYSFSEVNGGVMCFKLNETTLNFFRTWREYFYKYFSVTNGWDQVSLRIALWQSGVSLMHYPIEYNVRGEDNRRKVDFPHIKMENGVDHMKPRIFHMHVDKKIHNGSYEVTYEEAIDHCKNNHYRY